MSIALSTISENSLDGIGDENDQRIFAPSLCGRARERLTLLKAFAHVVQTKQRKVVMLHGSSGSGKTALVEHFRECLCEMDNVFFCTGKYFQMSSGDLQEPFSAIMAAFSDLCDLVSQSHDLTAERQRQISEHIGPDAYLLKKVISNLNPFLDKTSTICNGETLSSLKTVGAVAKFKIACKTFLQAMASGPRAIVLFLDDIQWMDEGSRHLLELYLNDTELQNVLFILAYRDEDAEGVRNSLCHVNMDSFDDIKIGDLKQSDVAQLVSGLLQSPQSKTKELADLVFQKTKGNPFHVMQFMEAIRRDGLLVNSGSQTNSWSFNVDAIQRDTMVPDTLADLLVRKIQRLPHEIQKALKIASLIGYCFDEEILAKVMSTISEEEHSSLFTLSLEKAFDLGLVEKTHDGVKFSHDKLQASFQSMVHGSEETRLQRIIGETFLSHPSYEGRVFHGAMHLNKAVDPLDTEQRLRLVRINLDASSYCIERSAFDIAASLLRQGLALLDETDKWSNNFDLAFALTEALAKMELTIGNLDTCKTLTQKCLLRAKSVDMKINSLLTAVECQMAGNELRSSIMTALSALGVLGLSIPQKIIVGHVFLKFLKVRRLLCRMTDDDILRLPLLQNEALAAATKILINLTWYCFLNGDETTGAYCGLVAAELTLGNGLSNYSASALIVYGGIELSFGNYARADRFGELGMTLMRQVRYRDTECMAICTWITVLSHWKSPMRNSCTPIRQAVESGFLSGDPLYTAIAIANDFGIYYYVGTNLSKLEVYMRATYSRLRDLCGDKMLLWAQPLVQSVLNLQRDVTQWIEATQLSGEVMDDTAYFLEVASIKNPVLLAVAGCLKGILCFYFGFVEQAEQMLLSALDDGGKAFAANYGIMSLLFHGTLTFYERYRASRKRIFLRRAHTWQRMLTRLESRGNPNVKGSLALLRAEDVSVHKSRTTQSIVSAYNLAIVEVKKEEEVNVEGLVNERAAFVLTEMGSFQEAKQYFQRAMYLYKYEWGATTKFEWLKEKYHTIQCCNQSNITDNVDLDIQMKVPQVLPFIHFPEVLPSILDEEDEGMAHCSNVEI